MINATQPDLPSNFSPIQATKAESTPAPTSTTVTSLVPKKKTNWKLLLGTLGLLLLLVGGGAAYWLSQQSQDVRQRAASDVYEAGQSCGTQGAVVCTSDSTKLVCQNYKLENTNDKCLTVEVWELQ